MLCDIVHFNLKPVRSQACLYSFVGDIRTLFPLRPAEQKHPNEYNHKPRTNPSSCIERLMLQTMAMSQPQPGTTSWAVQADAPGRCSLLEQEGHVPGHFVLAQRLEPGIAHRSLHKRSLLVLFLQTHPSHTFQLGYMRTVGSP